MRAKLKFRFAGIDLRGCVIAIAVTGEGLHQVQFLTVVIGKIR